jgi:hypothetical protein
VIFLSVNSTTNFKLVMQEYPQYQQSCSSVPKEILEKQKSQIQKIA